MVVLLDASAELQAPWPVDPRRSCASVVREIANRRLEAVVARSAASPNSGPGCEIAALHVVDGAVVPAWSGPLRGRGFVAVWELSESIVRWRPRSAAFPVPPSRSPILPSGAPGWLARVGEVPQGISYRLTDLLEAWRELHPGGDPLQVLCVGMFAHSVDWELIEQVCPDEAVRAFSWVGPRDTTPIAYPAAAEVECDSGAAGRFAWSSPVSEVVRSAAGMEGMRIARDARMFAMHEDLVLFEHGVLSDAA